MNIQNHFIFSPLLNDSIKNTTSPSSLPHLHLHNNNTTALTHLKKFWATETAVEIDQKQGKMQVFYIQACNWAEIPEL